jgi:hypothetical protein
MSVTITSCFEDSFATGRLLILSSNKLTPNHSIAAHRMRSCCHPPLAGENPIDYQLMPACAGSRLQPFRIQLRRDAVKAQPCGPQRLHALDYSLFAIIEAVGLTAFFGRSPEEPDASLQCWIVAVPEVQLDDALACCV